MEKDTKEKVVGEVEMERNVVVHEESVLPSSSNRRPKVVGVTIESFYGLFYKAIPRILKNYQHNLPGAIPIQVPNIVGRYILKHYNDFQCDSIPFWAFNPTLWIFRKEDFGRKVLLPLLKRNLTQVLSKTVDSISEFVETLKLPPEFKDVLDARCMVVATLLSYLENNMTRAEEQLLRTILRAPAKEQFVTGYKIYFINYPAIKPIWSGDIVSVELYLFENVLIYSVQVSTVTDSEPQTLVKSEKLNANVLKQIKSEEELLELLCKPLKSKWRVLLALLKGNLKKLKHVIRRMGIGGVSMAKRRRGPVSREVKIALSEFVYGRISDSEFQNRIQNILNNHGNRGIGSALQKWMVYLGLDERERDRVWRLVDEVDPRIRAQFESCRKSYPKSDEVGKCSMRARR